jgi:prepilin-type N-terminal cleavage/methylation domain-containing protein
MRTCSAPTPTDRLCVCRANGPRSQPGSVVLRSGCVRGKAFTLVELLVVMSLISLLVLIAQVNLFDVLRRNTFKAQLQGFVSLMQMAASRAAESGHRYEMIIDLADQTYLLRELTGSDLTAPVQEEQIIAQGAFRGNCKVAYVEFDDGTYANTSGERTKFRAGHAGWQYGGKVVFLDESEHPYAVVVNRVTPIVQLIEGDPPLMKPKAKEKVPFL